MLVVLSVECKSSHRVTLDSRNSLLSIFRRGYRVRILAIHISICLTNSLAFESSHLEALKKLKFVPVAEKNGKLVKYMRPNEVFVGSQQNTTQSKLFMFVDFGPKANAFLQACGARAEPTVQQVVEILLADPARFLEIVGGASQW